MGHFSVKGLDPCVKAGGKLCRSHRLELGIHWVIHQRHKFTAVIAENIMSKVCGGGRSKGFKWLFSTQTEENQTSNALKNFAIGFSSQAEENPEQK